MEAYLMTKLPFPAELIQSILEYKLRPDWKSCRKHESDLVKKFQRIMVNKVEDRVLDIEYWILDDNMLSEVSVWSLFGMRYILRWLEYGGANLCGRPPIRPLENRSGDNYEEWYDQTFMCCCYGI